MDAFSRRYGPWAVIAGASEGIGEAWAEALAARGLKLVLIARREAKLRATSERIAAAHGVETLPLPLDLGDPELPTRLREGLREGGREREVGLLIYNAALSRVGGFFEQSLDDKLSAIDVNCRGPIVLCHELGAPMLARGHGGIVLMGSLAGRQGSPRIATYAATKAFNLILAESLWGELGEAGVDVLACVAGATRTPGFEAITTTASAPVMEPEQVVAEAIEALGWRPSVVTGLANKLITALVGALPRRRRVLVMKAAMAGNRDAHES